MTYKGERHDAIRALQYGHPDITSQAIADELGVTRGAVSHWLCGRRPWPAKLSICLLNDFHVSADQIGRAMCEAETEAAERDALGPPP